MLITTNLLTSKTPEGRSKILHAPGMVPTIKLTAYKIEYYYDIPEAFLAGLVRAGILPSEPGTAPDGQPSPLVDLLEATRAWMHFGLDRWDGSPVARMQDRTVDKSTLTDRLGRFLVAIAFARPDWQFTLSPLHGFVAADHNIYYGTAIREMREYAAGKCPE